MAPGYRPVLSDLHREFFGYTGDEIEFGTMRTAFGDHYTDIVRGTLEQFNIPQRIGSWERFQGSYNPDGPIVLCCRSSTLEKDWMACSWRPVKDALTATGYQVELETSGDLYTLERQLRNAQLVVSVDTGSLHLADLMDIPVLGLYRDTNPKRHGPLGPSARTLYHRNFNTLPTATLLSIIHDVLKNPKL